jgi:oligoendopeptidase F
MLLILIIILGGSDMLEQKAVKKLPTRSEVQEELTWKLEDIYETDAKWEAEYKKVLELIPSFSEFKGKLGESSQTLLNALKKQDEISFLLGK